MGHWRRGDLGLGHAVDTKRIPARHPSRQAAIMGALALAPEHEQKDGPWWSEGAFARACMAGVGESRQNCLEYLCRAALDTFEKKNEP
jgi:hypothetical protein